MNTPFKMKGFSGFGNSPMRNDEKKTKEKGPSIFGTEIKDIKEGFSNIVKEVKVKADQIPFVGPGTSVYSTKAKATEGSFTYDPKATINQPGYEDIKARITGTPRKKMTKTVKPIKRFTKTVKKIDRIGQLKQSTTKTTKTKKPTYKQAWTGMSKKQKAKHGDYATFVKSAKAYNKKD